MRKHSTLAKRGRAEKLFAFSYLIPTLAIFILFCVIPYLKSFYMSFFKWSAFTNTGVFVGLDNFKRLIKDPVILTALKNNLFLLFWCTLFTFVISIFFANIVCRKRYRENAFFRILFFVPHVLSVTIVAILWSFLYNPSFGVINILLEKIGLGGLQRIWLGDKDVIMGALTVPMVWINVGFYLILFISAISNISPEIYESAEVDGANERRQFFSITLPCIWESVRTALAFFIITAFNYSFELVYVMTKGGPNRASELLTTYLYEVAFVKSDFGYSSAIGMVLFVLTAGLVFLVLNVTKPKEER